MTKQDQAAWDAGLEDAHMQHAAPLVMAAHKKHRVAVLQERKNFADALDAIAATPDAMFLASAIANHNLAMRKLEAEHHKKISDLLKVPKIPSPFAASVKPKPKKQTAAKFFAKKAKKAAAKKKPAPKKPAKKAAKRKR